MGRFDLTSGRQARSPGMRRRSQKSRRPRPPLPRWRSPQLRGPLQLKQLEELQDLQELQLQLQLLSLLP